MAVIDRFEYHPIQLVASEATAAQRTIIITLTDSGTGLPKTGVAAVGDGTDILISKNGAAQSNAAAGGRDVTEISTLGVYAYTFAATDINTIGTVTVEFAIAGTKTLAVVVQITALDLTDSVRAGLTALPNAAAQAVGGLPVYLGAYVNHAPGGITMDNADLTNVNTFHIEDDGITGQAIHSGAADELSANLLATVMTELAQAAPDATPTVQKALMLLYMALRNASTSTATERAVYNNAGTKVAKATVADDGTTFTQGKLVSGA